MKHKDARRVQTLSGHKNCLRASLGESFEDPAFGGTVSHLSSSLEQIDQHEVVKAVSAQGFDFGAEFVAEH